MKCIPFFRTKWPPKNKSGPVAYSLAHTKVTLYVLNTRPYDFHLFDCGTGYIINLILKRTQISNQFLFLC